MSSTGPVQLAQGGCVDHLPAFLEGGEADRLLAAVLEATAWESREIVLFGKRVLQPRLVAWAGDVPYTYSGQTLEPRPASPLVADVMRRVSACAGTAFNHVLVNRYRDGRDSMGMHADDEPELGPEPTVATLSLGATRRFVLAPRRGPRARVEYQLAHGSLLVMSGACQARYRHGVPRTAVVTGERVSLTFRRILAA